jgi:hypothetical protein
MLCNILASTNRYSCRQKRKCIQLCQNCRMLCTVDPKQFCTLYFVFLPGFINDGKYLFKKNLEQYVYQQFNARILKAHSHSHSMSGASIWAALECQCCCWITGGRVVTEKFMTLALQLFKNSINTQEKLSLNLHSLSVSELLEYRRKNL